MDGENAFGQWLKGRRKQYGYTQRELAEIIGCSPVTIEKIEEGKNRPSRQLAELLARALGVEDAEAEAFVRFARSALSHPGANGAAVGALQPQPGHRTDQLARHYPTLPGHLTPLVGREREVNEACDLLRKSEVRLLTLTGPGGIGKTRLGVRVAEQLYDTFKDGV